MTEDSGRATGSHPVWDGAGWVSVRVPVSGAESIVVPNTAAIVFSDESMSQVLLQRRDKEREPVRGLLEIPGGRWRAGESPFAALVREIKEETGLTVERVIGDLRRHEAQEGRPFVTATPVCVTVGVEGAYPALVVGFACIATGTPRPQVGETADPRWYPVGDIVAMLERPERFTGPTYAILTEYFGGGQAS